MPLISGSPFELSRNKLAMKQRFYSKKKKEKAVIEKKIKATVDATTSSQ